MKIKKPVRPEVKPISEGGAADVSVTPQSVNCTRVSVDVSDRALMQAAVNLLPEIIREATARAVHENYDTILAMVAEEIPKQREAMRQEIWREIAAALARLAVETDEEISRIAQRAREQIGEPKP